jgi:hypothetical protein
VLKKCFKDAKIKKSASQKADSKWLAGGIINRWFRVG